MRRLDVRDPVADRGTRGLLERPGAELDGLNELIREKYVGALTTSLHAATEQHDLVTILRDELRQRPAR